MHLTVWTYEGPPHMGAIRVASSMKGVHCVLHAPSGDSYADLLFTMVERRPSRPAVTYSSFDARDMGGDSAALFQDTLRKAYERFRPQVILTAETCTGELLQDDPGGLGKAVGLPVPVVPLKLPSYMRKDNWGASEAFHSLVRGIAGPKAPPGGKRPPRPEGAAPSCNILGPISLGFRNRDDVEEVRKLLDLCGVRVNVVAPLGASAHDLARLGEADFNVVLYPEIADTAARFLERAFGQPSVRTVPIGVGATRDFLAEVARVAGLETVPALDDPRLRMPWYSRSVDSNYLTGKRVFLFGDATHVMACARVAAEEMGFAVVGLGTYSREFARDVRACAEKYGVEALISDDYLEVEAAIEEARPEIVLGTQMERHIAKRLGVPCAVISSPVHVQDFPARYAPQMGVEGANVLFDTWVHPLMMGLEEHLLGMFREDFEFHAGAGASHLVGGVVPRGDEALAEPATAVAEADGDSPSSASGGASGDGAPVWEPEAERELKKIPFFVRGKARRNTERYAAERGLARISIETLYDAKAHFGS
ncbi:ferredoxin:protochlorophyllide reductase (ATP-dependent) subunit B [Phaeovibrio sulfidiphilus]|uniref:Light-independent protochlorophyllide reductase subunit B n=1 Tax=Phaeovibrio sulfidiphilus TaxID=1220600 RepID=A0A8J7CBE6_9PROT|nr:ferredoxin:protochlorophyllide reductase (ATP-dependent) subunit B [Phaeovibrio sulfidiphilus]MBE1236063.1 ferredoxin:protochlorophyllide reductase (ATP-dependent) subunit B [Phaeovibrio sulfidiphilus]